MSAFDSAFESFRLRQELKMEPVGDSIEESVRVSDGWGRFGNFALVGHGDVGSPNCGKFVTFKGCLLVDLHNKTSLDGTNYAGKVFVRRVRFSCGKPSCPVCYSSGWAVREAGNIERRLASASAKFGLAEHIVVALPPELYGLSFEGLRRKAVEVLSTRNVVGGVLIFHGFRYNPVKRWYWSPHFHCIGFIKGGYGRCRGCAKCVKGCGGFVDRSYRLHEKDDCIVKVLGERKTVFGTAWYQLNHASLKVDAVRFHVATWFGVCSYRKLKVKREATVEVCPICGHELIQIRYFGAKRLNLDGGVKSFEDFMEDGRVVWVERERNAYYGGSGSSVD